MAAPKLETLGCLSDFHGTTELMFGGSTVIQGLCVVNLTMAVHTVKILALSAHSLSLDVVIDFIGCFPCLERLYIESKISGGDNLCRRKHRKRLKCLDLRLKNIVLTNYRGTNSQVSFATFFIWNAGMLESMKFVVDSKIFIDGSWMEDQRSRLLVENRASRGAQFDFTSYTCRHQFLHVKGVHDLSVADPFACRC